MIAGFVWCLSQLCLNAFAISGQVEVYDVFTYQPPPFFSKTDISTGIEFSLENNDTSFCTISMYKKNHSAKNLKATIMRQWDRIVRTNLTNADRVPSKIMTGEKLDGWESALSVGSFYHHKKKSVVMLYSFKKRNESACIVFAFSDKSFKQPVEEFSRNLHLINN